MAAPRRPTDPSSDSAGPARLVGIRAGGRPESSAVGWLALVLGFGLAATLGSIWHQGLAREALVRQLDATRALGQIEADVAVAHLWVEEHVSGDRVDLGELRARTKRAGEASAELASGGLEGSDELRRRVELFAQITEDRLLGLGRGLAVGIGSSFDVEYDRQFAQVLAAAGAAAEALDRIRAEERRHTRARFESLLLVWSLTLLAAVAGFWQRERRRLRLAADLEERDRRLSRAQEADRLGRLAGGLAHDINNYLAAIRGQSELARSMLDRDSPAVAKLDAVLGTVTRASALLDRLLVVGRKARRGSTGPAAGGPPESAFPMIDLEQALRRWEPVARGLAGDRFELSIRGLGEPGLVRLDPLAFEQAVSNLVANAIDAMPEGGRLRLELRALDRAASGLGVEALGLAVHDDGVGIEPERLAQVFEPFYSTKAGGAGHAGLGLAVVDGIVTEAGGRARVESRVGEGTCFELVLPRVRGDETLGGGEALLVVERREERRETLAMLLETMGHEVAGAATGTAAVRLLEDSGQGASTGPAAVLLGQLDEPDGLLERLAQATGRLPSLPRPAILDLTGGIHARGLDGHGSDWRQRGAVLDPDASSRHLLEALRALLDRGAGSDAERAPATSPSPPDP